VPEAVVTDEAVVVEIATGDGEDLTEDAEFHVAVGTRNDAGWGHREILQAASEVSFAVRILRG